MVDCSLHVRNSEYRLIITSPPLRATSRRMSSGTFRDELHSAYADECEKITGASLVASVSRIVPIETCDRSTIMPMRFISRTIVCVLVQRSAVGAALKEGG